MNSGCRGRRLIPLPTLCLALAPVGVPAPNADHDFDAPTSPQSPPAGTQRAAIRARQRVSARRLSAISGCS